MRAGAGAAALGAGADALGVAAEAPGAAEAATAKPDPVKAALPLTTALPARASRAAGWT